MAERVGFEPTDVFTSPVFKTGSLNRSDISPNRFQARLKCYHEGAVLSTQKSAQTEWEIMDFFCLFFSEFFSKKACNLVWGMVF